MTGCGTWRRRSQRSAPDGSCQCLVFFVFIVKRAPTDGDIKTSMPIRPKAQRSFLSPLGVRTGKSGLPLGTSSFAGRGGSRSQKAYVHPAREAP
jgi:hypothetical protein